MRVQALISAPGTDQPQDVLAVQRRQCVFAKAAADADAATATGNTIIGYLPSDRRVVITGASFIPEAALTKHASNNASLIVTRLDLGGSSGDYFATLTTDTTNWVEGVAAVLTLDSLYTNWLVDGVRGTAIRFAISKQGTGVVVPKGVLVIDYLLY